MSRLLSGWSRSDLVAKINRAIIDLGELQHMAAEEQAHPAFGQPATQETEWRELAMVALAEAREGLLSGDATAARLRRPLFKLFDEIELLTEVATAAMDRRRFTLRRSNPVTIIDRRPLG